MNFETRIKCGTKLLKTFDKSGVVVYNTKDKILKDDLVIETVLPQMWEGDLKTPGLEFLCFTANEASSTISMTPTIVGTVSVTPNFQYSTNGTDWNTFTPNTTTITLSNINDKVYFKGDNANGVSVFIDDDNYSVYQFVMTGSISASGNIMSLIDNGACVTKTIPSEFCFGWMFKGCTSLTSPPELPATTLSNYCYEEMFNGCSSLATAPVLPASTLTNGCYNSMFSQCSSLTIPPSLIATVLPPQCYNAMFSSCSSLSRLPKIDAPGYYYDWTMDYMFVGANVNIYDTYSSSHPYEWRLPMTGTSTQQSENATIGIIDWTGGDHSEEQGFSLNTTYYLEYAPV